MYCFKWDTTQINSSLGCASSSMGARCFAGLVVLSLSPIVNTIFPGSSCIRAVSSFVRVWHRWPVNKQRSIVVFLVRDFRSNCVGGPKDPRCWRTTLTSQMKLYLGKEGLSSNTPLRRRAPRGCVPKVMLLGELGQKTVLIRQCIWHCNLNQRWTKLQGSQCHSPHSRPNDWFPLTGKIAPTVLSRHHTV